MKDSPSFEFRILGQDLTKQTLKLGDLATIAADLEKALMGVVARDNPELSETSVASLQEIGEGSVRLMVTGRHFKALLAAYIVIGLAVKQKQVVKLPEESCKALESLTVLSRKRNWTFEMHKPKRKTPIAIITPLTDLRPATHVIKGNTTIYGQIIRVGGIQPAVQLRLPDQKLLICDVEKTMAVMLAQRLYSIGRFDGQAIWAVDNFEILHFQITAAHDFRELTVIEAFGELRATIGEYFEDVDPSTYVASLRDEN